MDETRVPDALALRPAGVAFHYPMVVLYSKELTNSTVSLEARTIGRGRTTMLDV